MGITLIASVKQFIENIGQEVPEKRPEGFAFVDTIQAILVMKGEAEKHEQLKLSEIWCLYMKHWKDYIFGSRETLAAMAVQLRESQGWRVQPLTLRQAIKEYTEAEAKAKAAIEDRTKHYDGLDLVNPDADCWLSQREFGMMAWPQVIAAQQRLSMSAGRIKAFMTRLKPFQADFWKEAKASKVPAKKSRDYIRRRLRSLKRQDQPSLPMLCLVGIFDDGWRYMVVPLSDADYLVGKDRKGGLMAELKAKSSKLKAVFTESLIVARIDARFQLWRRKEDFKYDPKLLQGDKGKVMTAKVATILNATSMTNVAQARAKAPAKPKS